MVFTACYNNLYGNIFILDPDDVCNNNNMQDNGEAGIDCGGGGCAACGRFCLYFNLVVYCSNYLII